MAELRSPAIAVPKVVRDLAAELLPHADEFGRGTAAALAAEYPGIDQLRIRDIAEAMCRVNAQSFFQTLSQDPSPVTIKVPDELHELTRELYRRSVPQQVLIGLLHGSVSLSTAAWSQELGRRQVSTDDALASVETLIKALTQLLELLARSVGEEYENERIRIARQWSLARLEKVKSILDGDDVDLVAVGESLGYRLTGTHIGLVICDDADGGEPGVRLEKAVKQLQQTATGPTLAVRSDTRTMWCWISEAQSTIGPFADVKVGVGLSAEGVTGFRDSHRQALEALRTADLMSDDSGSVFTFSALEMLALCSVDPERTRRFIHRQLGPLAEDSEAAARMRETLSVFYEQNCNFRATAARMHLHHNTVRYRIEQIESLVGRPTAEGKLSRQLALHLFGFLREDPTVPAA